jgi:Cu2+-exporting ATPase
MPEVHHHDPTVAAHDSRADLAHDQPAANQHPGDHAQARHADHDKHAGHDPEMFRRRFWLSLLFTVPLVVRSRSKTRFAQKHAQQ